MKRANPILLMIILLSTLTGCAALPRSVQIEETAFLALHAVDGLQTANIPNTPHAFEAESAWAIGREPSARSTAAYFAAIALVHFAVTRYLCAHHVKPWIIQAWELGSIAWGVRDVAANSSIGVPILR